MAIENSGTKLNLRSQKARTLLNVLGADGLSFCDQSFIEELRAIAGETTDQIEPADADAISGLIGLIEKDLSPKQSADFASERDLVCHQPKPPAPRGKRVANTVGPETQKTELLFDASINPGVQSLANLMRGQHPAVIKTHISAMSEEEAKQVCRALSGETVRHLQLLMWR